MLVAWLSFMAPTKSAADTENGMTLYLNYLPYRLTMESGSQYDLFLSEVFPERNAEVALLAAPLQRAKYLFLENKNSCLFPSALAVFEGDGGTGSLLVSEPVDYLTLRLYTREPTHSDVALDGFAPSRLGVINGAVASRLFGKKLSHYAVVSSEEQLITMMELGRLDAIVGYHPDIALAFEKHGKPDLVFAQNKFINGFRYPLSFICHENETGRHFIGSINETISKMNQSGRLLEILGPHADVAGSLEPARPLTE